MNNDELLKKIEAFIAGPIAPRPAIPVKQREHAQIADDVRETEEEAGEEKHEDVKQREDHGQGDVKDPKHDRRLRQNKNKDKVPYERERDDHRANLKMLAEIRNDPVYGSYVNQALGSQPTPTRFAALYQKIDNLRNIASGQEREELQKFASKVANLIVKALR